MTGDSNPERVRGVKKTVRWTVFSLEIRSSYAARMKDAKRLCPSQRTIKTPTAFAVGVLILFRDSNPVF